MGDYLFGTFLTFMFVSMVLSMFIALAVYFLPIIIAVARKHKQVVMISVMTIFIGWTFLGWLAAVLWSLNSDVKTDEESNC